MNHGAWEPPIQITGLAFAFAGHFFVAELKPRPESPSGFALYLDPVEPEVRAALAAADADDYICADAPAAEDGSNADWFMETAMAGAIKMLHEANMIEAKVRDLITALAADDQTPN